MLAGCWLSSSHPPLIKPLLRVAKCIILKFVFKPLNVDFQSLIVYTIRRFKYFYRRKYVTMKWIFFQERGAIEMDSLYYKTNNATIFIHSYSVLVSVNGFSVFLNTYWVRFVGKYSTANYFNLILPPYLLLKVVTNTIIIVVHQNILRRANKE